jgi:hypothetical protein
MGALEGHHPCLYDSQAGGKSAHHEKGLIGSVDSQQARSDLKIGHRVSTQLSTQGQDL